MPHLFVYGSLRTGNHNHPRLRNAPLLGTFRTKELYKMVGLRSRAYPYVYPDPQGTPVTGELYEVDAETLDFIDRMEGHPTVYCRMDTELTGWPTSVQMYVLVDRQLKRTLENYGHMSRRFVLIPSGDWNNQQMQTTDALPQTGE